jgi:hypothetical protein
LGRGRIFYPDHLAGSGANDISDLDGGFSVLYFAAYARGFYGGAQKPIRRWLAVGYCLILWPFWAKCWCLLWRQCWHKTL